MPDSSLSDRRAPAPIRGRPVTGAAATGRPSPMPSWSSAGCARASPPAAPSTWISRAARAAIRGSVAQPLGLSIEDAAAGIVDVVEQHLLHAVEHMSIERGHSPRRFTLVAAGGAGPMHGAAVAGGLGCNAVYVPRDAGALCAVGMLHADIRAGFRALPDGLHRRGCGGGRERGIRRAERPGHRDAATRGLRSGRRRPAARTGAASSRPALVHPGGRARRPDGHPGRTRRLRSRVPAALRTHTARRDDRARLAAAHGPWLDRCRRPVGRRARRGPATAHRYASGLARRPRLAGDAGVRRRRDPAGAPHRWSRADRGAHHHGAGGAAGHARGRRRRQLLHPHRPFREHRGNRAAKRPACASRRRNSIPSSSHSCRTASTRSPATWAG